MKTLKSQEQIEASTAIPDENKKPKQVKYNHGKENKYNRRKLNPLLSMEETTIEAGMKKDCITQGEADITSKQSEYTRNTENTTTQRRISAKMRKETLEAYKQTFLFPIKLSD